MFLPIWWALGLAGTAWKESKYGVFSGPHFPVFSPNGWKCGPEKTSYLDTFPTVRYTLDEWCLVIFIPHRMKLLIQKPMRGYYQKISCVLTKVRLWIAAIGQVLVRVAKPGSAVLPIPFDPEVEKMHCVKSDRIRSFSGLYFRASGLNMERHFV